MVHKGGGLESKIFKICPHVLWMSPNGAIKSIMALFENDK